jgi:hypothetical protein
VINNSECSKCALVSLRLSRNVVIESDAQDDERLSKILGQTVERGCFKLLDSEDIFVAGASK